PRTPEIYTLSLHDALPISNEHLAEVAEDPDAHRLGAPLTVVYAADDPATPPGPQRRAGWAPLTDDLGLEELGDGGHYFCQEIPTDRKSTRLNSSHSQISYA